MAQRKKQRFVTVDLPLDLILECYAACIRTRMTFDQFVEESISDAWHDMKAAEKKELLPGKVAKKGDKSKK